MEEVIGANLTIAVVAFFLLYFPYRELCNGVKNYAKIMLSVMLFYYIFYFGTVMGFATGTPATHLWYPYSFGGMPSYALGGVGVKWWNHVDVLLGGLIRLLFYNPIFTAVFSISLYFLVKRWLHGKKIVWSYILTILAEVTTIFTTEWK